MTTKVPPKPGMKWNGKSWYIPTKKIQSEKAEKVLIVFADSEYPEGYKSVEATKEEWEKLTARAKKVNLPIDGSTVDWSAVPDIEDRPDSEIPVHVVQSHDLRMWWSKEGE